MMKLPRPGDPEFKYQFDPQVNNVSMLFALELWREMIKLPRTGYPVPNYQFASQVRNYQEFVI